MLWRDLRRITGLRSKPYAVLEAGMDTIVNRLNRPKLCTLTAEQLDRAPGSGPGDWEVRVFQA